MAKRVLLLIPEGLTFEQLNEEQQSAIRLVLGQYVTPMPSTVASNGFQVCDAVTGDNFRPDTMSEFGIEWPVLGVWDEEGSQEEPQFNRELFLQHLPEGMPLHETHRWAGWPPCSGFSEPQ